MPNYPSNFLRKSPVEDLHTFSHTLGCNSPKFSSNIGRDSSFLLFCNRWSSWLTLGGSILNTNFPSILESHSALGHTYPILGQGILSQREQAYLISSSLLGINSVSGLSIRIVLGHLIGYFLSFKLFHSVFFLSPCIYSQEYYIPFIESTYYVLSQHNFYSILSFHRFPWFLKKKG